MNTYYSLVGILEGKKTYIVAGLLVLVALVQTLTGDMSWSMFFDSESFTTLLEGLGLASLRAGVSKAL